MTNQEYREMIADVDESQDFYKLPKPIGETQQRMFSNALRELELEEWHDNTCFDDDCKICLGDYE